MLHLTHGSLWWQMGVLHEASISSWVSFLASCLCICMTSSNPKYRCRDVRFHWCSALGLLRASSHGLRLLISVLKMTEAESTAFHFKCCTPEDGFGNANEEILKFVLACLFFLNFLSIWLKESFSVTLAFLVAKTAVSLTSCWSVWPPQSNINKMWQLFSKTCPFDIPNPYTRLTGNRIWFCSTVADPSLSWGKWCDKWKITWSNFY